MTNDHEAGSRGGAEAAGKCRLCPISDGRWRTSWPHEALRIPGRAGNGTAAWRIGSFPEPKGGGDMVVVMAADATEADADNVVGAVQDAGGSAFVSRSVSRTIVGITGDIDRLPATLNLARLPGAADVVRISVPYQPVSRRH